jgi:hypothetical protein
MQYALRKWGKMTGRGWLYGGGWLDIHATRAATVTGPIRYYVDEPILNVALDDIARTKKSSAT